MITLTTSILFLGGIAAAIVPVVLHLLMQGKPKTIEFPAIMFLTTKIETHRRNYRLKHILLLLLRMLIFALLGLALAQPVINLSNGIPFFPSNSVWGSTRGFASLGSQDAPVAVAIVIDTSVRMGYVANNKTRLEEAQEFARWILRQLPANSSIALLGCEQEPPVFQVDSQAAEDKIDRLRITPLGRPVAEIVQGAAALLASSPLEYRELYVLSDLSLPGWDVSGISESLQQWGGSIFLIDVSVEKPMNSSFRQFQLIPEQPMADSPIQMDVQVAHFGQATTKTVELVLIGSERDPNEETVRISRSVEFSDGESQQSVSLSLAGGWGKGTNQVEKNQKNSIQGETIQGKLRFSTSDALPIDDQCWFTLSVQPPRKMLLFAQPPVHDSALFLRTALETAFLNVESRPLSELAGMTLIELQEYHAVVLLDPPPFTSGIWKRLADYASEGYGVGTFLGSSAESLESFNDPAAVEVLGASLVRQVRNPAGELWIMPNVSPIFTPFRLIGTMNRVPWEALPVFRYWELGEVSQRADVAASFSDNRPAILTQTLGHGRTLLGVTPISENAQFESFSSLSRWNELTSGEASWVFVLLAEGMARFLVGLGDQRTNFIVGEPVVLRPNVPSLPENYLLKTPRGSSERLTPDLIRREMSIPSASEPGNYTIRSGGMGDSALNLGFSVNIPSSATTLVKADHTILDRLFGAEHYKIVRTHEEIESRTARQRVGQEMYAVIMLLLAAFFVGEYLLANRIYWGKKGA